MTSRVRDNRPRLTLFLICSIVGARLDQQHLAAMSIDTLAFVKHLESAGIAAKRPKLMPKQ